MQIHVLILCSYIDENKSTGAIRMAALRKYLCEHGIKVTIITTESSAHCEVSNIFGINDFVNNWSERYSSLSFILRSVRKLCYFIGGINCHSLYRKFFSQFNHVNFMNKVDVIVASSPQPEILDVACHLKRIHNVSLISDFRDGLMYEPLYKYNYVERIIYSKLEKNITKYSDKIVTVSQPITDYFSDNYSLDTNRVATITNGFSSIVSKSELLKLNDIKASSIVADKVNIVYTGKIGKSRSELFISLQIFVDAFQNLHQSSKDRINVIFIGDFTSREIDIFPSEFCVLEPVSRAIAVKYQQSADQLLLFTGPHKSVVTGKIFEYIQTGVPILAISNGSYAESIMKYLNAGSSFYIGSKPELTKFLEGVEKSNNRVVSSNIIDFTHKVLFEKYSSIIREVVNFVP